METITVHNSSRRNWLVAGAGVLLILAAIDLLVWNEVTAVLAERIFGGEEVLEARERVWAGMMAAVGVVLTVWGVTRGFGRRPALTVGPEGLGIALRGPYRPLDHLPWEGIERIFSQPVADGGSRLPSLAIVLGAPELRRHLPIDPWGARWAGGHILRVLASDWSVRAETVAGVSNQYLEAAAQTAPSPDHE